MKEAFVNAMVTALEGGINYWCDEVNLFDGKGAQMSIEDWCDHGSTIQVYYDDDAILIEMQKAFFANVDRLFPDWEEVFSDEGNYDAADADQWMQLGVFGEVIFG